MKVVINRCYGGFGLSDAAYEKLIEWGIPVKKYMEQDRDPVTQLYKEQPLNDGEVIFDRELTPVGENNFNDIYHKYKGKVAQRRYWDCWTQANRSHPLILRVVEELGDAASSELAELKIVEIPDGVEFEIGEYDGIEHIAEKHRTWS